LFAGFNASYGAELEARNRTQAAAEKEFTLDALRALDESFNEWSDDIGLVGRELRRRRSRAEFSCPEPCDAGLFCVPTNTDGVGECQSCGIGCIDCMSAGACRECSVNYVV